MVSKRRIGPDPQLATLPWLVRCPGGTTGFAIEDLPLDHGLFNSGSVRPNCSPKGRAQLTRSIWALGDGGTPWGPSRF